jgi:hypothetical protein
MFLKFLMLHSVYAKKSKYIKSNGFLIVIEHKIYYKNNEIFILFFLFTVYF